ncbi:cell division ATP-binding protein FtsE [Candidatus Roizmanbacteria bacterium RIFCSPHIGHO2_02_FULL_37_15]|uniref:Cell division ATP-binding protein FtsE n=1 Tax=Candidatus Roizmanbacteria bacterium RIFCSPLOWO2_01_FULL_37_16 TaxID=1802058 RepID=A0A1F7IQ81_9BACT|nr:MAG: cell division ATP-binding protein FtsE [Candidatus Roizmanbacteria bacterium RIFCSPHIGHO2_01_FULL_37_16b]OGK21196.1 MAG: cell division ATP-binding protein FtsE [Candidatus Roizmanbacteria bacterium RIFCSPHIGHO2_02_FULL_37_15]OGK32332.1 MAG: cell division ATP-binding protein FtsE [Candidatus Roizmanbacteria bacterium RIFCSPHIGHO2_12_FULL_36_11]OGK45519.1 MAG: cell division ATP-binding protein FtsE [Candidatus Roizmanbacteria bacterium RIFCSPLOWO2_01_FULL_37_16]OGK55723.1 MAG: cell divisi
MIKFENVTKKFPLGNLALDELSFEIDDEEFVFIVGPSGAGKTTILKLLLREYLPTTGSILVDDFDIASRSFSQVEILRRKIGMIFQDFKILFDKNVYENVALSLKVIGLSDDQIKKEVRNGLNLVDLAKKENAFPIQLSAGEIQRVAIARAIVGDRDIILADEPTGNLDPKTTWEIMKIFKKLEGEKTVLFATHNTDVVNSLQKRVLVLKQGKLIKDQRKGGYEL